MQRSAYETVVMIAQMLWQVSSQSMSRMRGKETQSSQNNFQFEMKAFRHIELFWYEE